MLKKFAALLLVAVMLICPLTVAADEGQADSVTDGVSSAVINKKATRVSVTLTLSDEFLDANKKATVRLFELSPGQSVADLASLSPVASCRATASRKLALPLTSLYSSYVAAIQKGDGSYSVIGYPKYIENIASLAQSNKPYPDALSIKGLQVSSVSDALTLGVSHAVIPVPVETMFSEASSSILSVPYDFGGVTHYFDRAALESLDDKVSSLSKEGVRVYLRFSLDTVPSDLPSYLSGLGYANAPIAPHYSIRVDTADSAAKMAALFSLMANRYADPDGEHGFCGSFIIGNAVNLPSQNYSTAPHVTLSNHVENYAALLRLAHIAMVSAYSNGRVYAAISNNFNLIPAGLTGVDVTSAEFLAVLCSVTARGGDFDWAIATDAYPYSRTDVSIWDDALATGASSQLISPVNISVFTDALSKAYTYNGAPRRLIIGNFAVASAQGEIALSHQAASYAYAYYKVVENGSVEALIYSNQFDTPDSADSFGLSNTDMSGNVLKKKDIWHALQSIDTPDSALLSNICSQVGGVVQYMFSTVSESAAVKQVVRGSAEVSSTLAPGTNLTTLFDFSTGERGGFEASGYGHNALPPLIRTANGSAILLEGGSDRALVNYGVSRSSLNSANKLAVMLTDCTEGTLTLRLSQGGKLMYSASANVKSTTGVVIFDVKQFRQELGSGEVAVALQMSGGASASLTSLSIARVTTMSSVMWIIVLVILVLFGLMLILALFTRLYHRYRRKASGKGD